MTRMKAQKTELLDEAIKCVKTLRHLTGNSADVAQVQKKLESLKEII